MYLDNIGGTNDTQMMNKVRYIAGQKCNHIWSNFTTFLKFYKILAIFKVKFSILQNLEPTLAKNYVIV